MMTRTIDTGKFLRQSITILVFIIFGSVAVQAAFSDTILTYYFLGGGILVWIVFLLLGYSLAGILWVYFQVVSIVRSISTPGVEKTTKTEKGTKTIPSSFSSSDWKGGPGTKSGFVEQVDLRPADPVSKVVLQTSRRWNPSQMRREAV